jgi:hypothetical protein
MSIKFNFSLLKIRVKANLIQNSNTNWMAVKRILFKAWQEIDNSWYNFVHIWKIHIPKNKIGISNIKNKKDRQKNLGRRMNIIISFYPIIYQKTKRVIYRKNTAKTIKFSLKTKKMKICRKIKINSKHKTLKIF